MIIGLCGAAGSGKDTTANILKNYLTSVEILAFAKPLKDAAKILFNFTEEQLHDPISKEVVDSRWNKSPREIFQWLGTQVLRNQIDKDFFIKHMEQRINQSDKDTIIITDIRFDNEAELIKNLGGIIIKIIRPNATTTKHNNHETEQGITMSLVDEIILNNHNTLEELSNKVILTVNKWHKTELSEND